MLESWHRSRLFPLFFSLPGSSISRIVLSRRVLRRRRPLKRPMGPLERPLPFCGRSAHSTPPAAPPRPIVPVMMVLDSMFLRLYHFSSFTPGAFGGRGGPPWRGGPPAPAAMAAIIFCAIAFNPPPAGPGALPGPPPCPGGPLKGGPFLPPPLAPSRPAPYSERNRAHNHTQKQIGKRTHGDKAASAPGTQKTPAEARALRALRPWSPHLSL